MSKSAMTPSFNGRTARIWEGVRPIMRFASESTLASSDFAWQQTSGRNPWRQGGVERKHGPGALLLHSFSIRPAHRRGSLGAMRVAILFPGQGSQYPGMADPWLDHPSGKEVLAGCSELLGWDVVEASRDAEALGRTEIVQPAGFACD